MMLTSLRPKVLGIFTEKTQKILQTVKFPDILRPGSISSVILSHTPARDPYIGSSPNESNFYCWKTARK